MEPYHHSFLRSGMVSVPCRPKQYQECNLFCSHCQLCVYIYTYCIISILCIYPFTYPSIRPSIHPSIHLSTSLFYFFLPSFLFSLLISLSIPCVQECHTTRNPSICTHCLNSYIHTFIYPCMHPCINSKPHVAGRNPRLPASCRGPGWGGEPQT